MKRRSKAIWFALWFSVRPWHWYEKECHHKGMTYSQHLWLNLTYALRWLFFCESESDIAFEKKVNNN